MKSSEKQIFFGEKKTFVDRRQRYTISCRNIPVYTQWKYTDQLVYWFFVFHTVTY